MKSLSHLGVSKPASVASVTTFGQNALLVTLAISVEKLVTIPCSVWTLNSLYELVCLYQVIIVNIAILFLRLQFTYRSLKILNFSFDMVFANFTF